MSTATAAVNAADTDGPNASHATSVSAAITSTAGTNTADTRSASRWIDAFPFCASVTSRPIRASWVSAPTLLARTRIRP